MTCRIPLILCLAALAGCTITIREQWPAKVTPARHEAALQPSAASAARRTNDLLIFPPPMHRLTRYWMLQSTEDLHTWRDVMILTNDIFGSKTNWTTITNRGEPVLCFRLKALP